MACFTQPINILSTQSTIKKSFEKKFVMSDITNMRYRTVGGKDATPYPVDRPTYDQTIAYMKEYVKKAKYSPIDKQKIMRKLN